MNKFFDVNNKFFTVMTKIWDMFVLNLVFVLTVLAFIGPACTGIYYATVKNIRKSRDYTARSFFHSFKQNFKQAAIIGVLQFIVGAGLYISYTFALAMDPNNTVARIYYWCVVGLIIIFCMVSVYVYPILSRFTMKTTAILRLALFMSYRHVVTTIVGVIGLVLLALSFRYVYLSPLIFFFAISAYVLILSFPMEKALHKYMPKKEDVDENEQEAWYYE